MKVAAAILAVLILFMTAQEPVLSSNSTPDKDCCIPESSCSPAKSSCSNEKPAPEKDAAGECCDMDFCNPFGACCPYTPADRTQLPMAGFFIQRKVATPADENTLSSYIGDIWQPPETGASF